jgi:hypothetical protein
MVLSNICALSYNQLIDNLFVFQDIKESKSVFFDSAVNKHSRSSTDINNKLKNLEIGVNIEREFTEYLHDLLDEKDKTLYVNIDDIVTVKPNVPQFIISDVSMKSIKNEVPLISCRVQPKCCGKNKSLNAEKVVVLMVAIKKKSWKRMGYKRLLKLRTVTNSDVDPLNESI